MAHVVPVPMLSLFTGYELEMMVRNVIMMVQNVITVC